MTEEPCADERLRGIAEVCFDLPEVIASTPTSQQCAFNVHGKPFVYYLIDPHGDGHNSVCFKARPEAAAALLEGDPVRFRRAAYLSKHGWVCLDLDAGPVDWGELRRFVTESYRLIAPRSLATAFTSDPEET